MEMNIEEIKKILPHRYPFLMIDRITDLVPGVSARGIKCITSNEIQFQGHFPSKPIMPGVLILEALAQTGAVAILSLPENRGKIAVFGSVKNCRFRRLAVPGDIINLDCEIINMRGNIGFGKVHAAIDGETAASGEISFALIEG